MIVVIAAKTCSLRAAEDCKLWSIQRSTVRSILTSIRGKLVANKIKMLGNVCIGEDTLKSKLSTSKLGKNKVAERIVV